MVIDLTRDQALVLFECLARWETTGHEPNFLHPAERVVLWGVQAQLEKVLVEPFRSDFDALLNSARERLSPQSGGK